VIGDWSIHSSLDFFCSKMGSSQSEEAAQPSELDIAIAANKKYVETNCCSPEEFLMDSRDLLDLILSVQGANIARQIRTNQKFRAVLDADKIGYVIHRFSQEEFRFLKELFPNSINKESALQSHQKGDIAGTMRKRLDHVATLGANETCEVRFHMPNIGSLGTSYFSNKFNHHVGESEIMHVEDAHATKL
jgi:hypothetical protein